MVPADATKAAASTNADTPATCRPEHAFHAFDTLYCALTRTQPIKPAFVDDKFPLFVTWNTRRYSASGNGGWSTRLRGCIGTFDAQPLRTALREYALLSAFRDHRFPKMELRELPALECGISLLTDFEDAASYLDWTVGTHGIQVSFAPPPSSSQQPPSDAPSPLSSAISLVVPRLSMPMRTLSATYLPEVAPDQGWDRIDAVDSAIRKAGWDGRISEDLRRSVRVRRYQSRKCVVSWDEFVEWRAERGAPVDLDAFEGL